MSKTSMIIPKKLNNKLLVISKPRHERIIKKVEKVIAEEIQIAKRIQENNFVSIQTKNECNCIVEL